MNLEEIRLPATIIHHDFMATDFENLDDLSQLLAYCFESEHSNTTRLIDCEGWEYEVASCTEHRLGLIKRFLNGRPSRFLIELTIVKRITLSDFVTILTDKLNENPDWWINNEELADIEAVKKIVANSEDLRASMEQLGWFSPEVC